MDEDYFLHISGRQEGPFTLRQLQERWRTRRGIDGDTLFWQNGMDDWLPLSTISDLLQTQIYNPYVAAARFHRESPKCILPTLILWFMLGGLGAHRFYIGRPYSGIIMLTFSMGGVIFGFAGQDFSNMGMLTILSGLLLVSLGIWLIIDMVRIVTGSMTDGGGRKIEKWT